MFKIDKMPSASGQRCKKVHREGTFYRKNNINNGFSLVELIVVIAILVVFAAILIPSLLQYTENSRAQKDESAMDEVVNAVQLAMADQNCFDEMLQYSCTNNYVTYSDSTGDYASQVIDGEFWAPDGAGRATTITFNPEVGSNNATIYRMDSAIINDMTYGNGSMAHGRVMEGALIENNQCYLKNASLNGNQTGYTYNRVRQTIGDSIINNSQTYRNSSFTIFIRFTQKDGVTVADVSGQFNGTNLYEGAPAAIGSGTTEYEPESGAPIVTITNPGTTQSNISSSALQGTGNFNGNSEYKRETDDVVNESGQLSSIRLRPLITDNIKNVIFTDTGLDNGIDVSNEQNGSVLAFIDGDTCTVSTNQPNKRVKAPDTAGQWFNYTNCEMIDVSGLSVGHLYDLNSVFRHFGETANKVIIKGLEYWDTSNVKNMSSLFQQVGQDNAISVSITGYSNWNTSNVETIEYMFTNCAKSAATSITLSDMSKWDTSNIQSLHSLFSSCAPNAQIMPNIGNLGNWDVSNVTDMHNAFNNFCHSAKGWSVGDLSNWNVSKVNDMSGMFYNTGGEIEKWSVGDLSSWDTSNVSQFYYMFSSIGRHSKIINISYVEKWDVSSAQNMSNMFAYVGTYGDANLDVHYGIDQTISIGDLSNWDVSNVTDMSSMFQNFGFTVKTWSIGNLGNWDVSNVENFTHMFHHTGYWSYETYIGDISLWNTSSATDMSNMMEGTSKQYTYKGIMYDCSNWNVDNVTNFENFKYDDDYHIQAPNFQN